MLRGMRKDEGAYLVMVDADVPAVLNLQCCRVQLGKEKGEGSKGI